MNLNITINGKPIPKARPRLTRDGLAYTPKQTRDYERSIKRAAIIEMAGSPLMDGAVYLDPVNVSVEISKSDNLGGNQNGIATNGTRQDQ